jgi:hypothetical protein
MRGMSDHDAAEQVITMARNTHEIAQPNLDPILDLGSGAGYFEKRFHAEFTSI